MKIEAYIAGAKKEVDGSHKEWIDDLLSRLHDNAVIFEIGSATSRDADYMEKMKPSVSVTRSDKEEGFITYMKNIGRRAVVFDALRDEFDPANKYDAFYAHMVMLHFNLAELEHTLKKMLTVLEKHGVIALSFASGNRAELKEWNSVEGNIFTCFHSKKEVEDIADQLNLSLVYFNEAPDKKRWYASFIST